MSEEQKSRCEFELWIEEYYGLPSGCDVKGKITTDYGDLVNLIAMFSDRQKKRNGWISVKDRLPDKSQKLLVFDGDAINFGRYFHSTEYGHVFGKDGWGQTYNVTHWQPLPPAPKQD